MYSIKDILMQLDHNTDSETDYVVDELTAAPWRVILYDDDIHTFDEVINQLIKATGCGVSKAEEITLTVHNKGKATAFEGDFEECLMVDSVLKEIQLVTEIKG